MNEIANRRMMHDKMIDFDWEWLDSDRQQRHCSGEMYALDPAMGLRDVPQREGHPLRRHGYARRPQRYNIYPHQLLSIQSLSTFSFITITFIYFSYTTTTTTTNTNTNTNTSTNTSTITTTNTTNTTTFTTITTTNTTINTTNNATTGTIIHDELLCIE